MSTLIAKSQPRETHRNGQRETLDVVALLPEDRGQLHERIAKRFHAMLDAGFVDEVCALRARGDLTAQMPSMRCVGYRQAWDYLDGVGSKDEFIAAGIAATRQLAKRQITWIRSFHDVQRIDPFDGSRAVTACAEILNSA